MVAHSILKACECAVMHECRLQANIAQRRGTKLVAIQGIAGHLLATEVLVCLWAVENSIRVLWHNLWNAEDVIPKIAEHLVRVARDTVASHTARRTEEQQRPALFILGQRAPLATREPVERCVGERKD